jgi:hypothetical protein
MLTVAEMHEHMRKLFDGLMLKGYWHPWYLPSWFVAVLVEDQLVWQDPRYGLSATSLTRVYCDRTPDGATSTKGRRARQKAFLFRHDWWMQESTDGEQWQKLTQVEATDSIQSYWSKTNANREFAMFLESMQSLNRRRGREDEDITL